MFQDICTLVCGGRSVITIKKFNGYFSWHADLEFLALRNIQFSEPVQLSEAGFPFLESAQRHSLYWLVHTLKLEPALISVEVKASHDRRRTFHRRVPAFVSTVRQIGLTLDK